MASAVGSACHSDPNFAVICCFLEKYGEILGLPVISFVDLQEYLEDTKTVSRPLVDLHVRLLKRIGKTNVNHERFERSITKFCFYFNDRDGWEIDRFGYRHAQLSTKLRVLKNLLECQFDYNVKFKEKINEFQPEELRFQPAGRDRDGMTYWYLLDKDLNVHIYREEPDDETADTWKLICSDRDQLHALLERLRNNTHRNFGEDDKDDKDDKSSIFTDESKTTSKEGTPDRVSSTPAFALAAVKEESDDVKHEPPGDPVSAVSDTQAQHTPPPVQTDKQETADSDSGCTTVKVKQEPVQEEVKPSDDSADQSSSLALSEESEVQTKSKKKTVKNKDKLPSDSDKASEQSPDVVTSSAENVCEVTLKQSDGADRSDCLKTAVSDRLAVDQSNSVISASADPQGDSSSKPEETDSGSASKDSGVSESNHRAKRREVSLQAESEDQSPEKKRRESEAVVSVCEPCISVSESSDLAIVNDGVDKSSVEENVEQKSNKLSQSVEKSLMKSDQKTDDTEAKTHEEAVKPDSAMSSSDLKENVLEQQASNEQDGKDQGKSNSGVALALLDDGKESTADLVSEPTEKVSKDQTVSKELADKTESASATSAEGPLSGEVDKKETKGHEDKPGEDIPGDVAKTEHTGDSSEGSEPAVAGKEGSETHSEGTSISSSEISDPNKTDQSVQKHRKEGQGNCDGENISQKDSSNQISDSKSSEKVDEGEPSAEEKGCSEEKVGESSCAASYASTLPECEMKDKPADTDSETKGVHMSANDKETGKSKVSEKEQKEDSGEKSEKKMTAQNRDTLETGSEEKCGDSDAGEVEKNKQDKDPKQTGSDKEKTNEIQDVNQTETPCQKASGSSENSEVSEKRDTAVTSVCEQKTDNSKTDPVEKEESKAEEQQDASVPSDLSDREKRVTPSAEVNSEKSAEPSLGQTEQVGVSKNVSHTSDNNMSVENSKEQDKSRHDQKSDGEHEVHSPGSGSTEEKSEQQTLSLGEENKTEVNLMSQNASASESTSVPDSNLKASEPEKTAELSKNKESMDSKVVEIKVVRLENCSSGPVDKTSVESSKGNKARKCEVSTDQDKNESSEMNNTKDSSVSKASTDGNKEGSNLDAMEVDEDCGKAQEKEEEPSKSRSLRKRRGRQGPKAKGTETTESVQNVNEDSLKDTQATEKDKTDDQGKPTDKEGEKNQDEPTDKQDAKNLVNGHSDLPEEQEKRDAEEQDAKTTQQTRTASRRGRGGARNRGRGGRGGSRAGKRTAAQVESEEVSAAAPAEKRARRGGAKRRGVSRTQQLARSAGQGKEAESSSDSNAPLINCKGQSKQSGAKGSGPKKALGSKKTADTEKDKDSSSSDDLPLSRAAKKKKIVGEDSSDFEPDEPIAPCKKSRGGKTSKPAAKTKKADEESAEKENELAALSAYSTRRSLRIQTMKKKEPDPDFDILSEAGQSGELSSEVELPSEEDSEDDDFKPHQGRNRRRQAALKKKEEEKVPMDDTPCLMCNKCTHPDMMLLCDSCDKGYHMACLRPPLMAIPEGDWFCPPCEHVKLIEKLTEYLRELDTNSRKKDRLTRRKERLAFVGISLDNILKEEKKPVVPSGKEAFYKERDEEDVEEEEEKEEETEEEEEYEREDQYVRPRRKKNKYARGSENRPSHRSRNSRKRHDRHHSDDDDDGNGLPEEVYAKRTCRTRSAVSYQFKEYDDLIKSAIQEDLNDPKPPRPRPPGRSRGKDLSNIPGMNSDEEEEEMEAEGIGDQGKKGIGKDMSNILGNKSDEEEEKEKTKKKKGKSRGKDMSNILGMDSDEEKELRRKQKEEALAAAAASEGRPPPVVKRKNRRRLTMLDSDDNQDDEDESEEFQISESDEDSDASVEASQDEDDDLTEEDSGAWRPRRTWFNKAASQRNTRKGGRRSRSRRDDFVVDDDYDSDELAAKRRSTRNSTKRRVRYRDWESDTEESEMETEESEESLSELSSSDSEYRRKKNRRKASRKKYTSVTESSGSEYMVRVNRAKKRRVASSDSDDDSGSSQANRSSKLGKTSKKSKAPSNKKGRPKKKISEDDSATEVEDEAPKKKKNVLRDSSSEEEAEKPQEELEYGEDEDTEVEGDSQQPEPVSQPLTGKTQEKVPENRSISDAADKTGTVSAVEQGTNQVSEAAPTTNKTSELEPEKSIVPKPKKPRSKGKGKKAVSQEEEMSEEDKPERVECGTGMQDDKPVSTIESASSAGSGPSAQQAAPPNFLNVNVDTSSAAGQESMQQGQNMPPFSSTPSTHPLSGDTQFQHPHGPHFRPHMEGGFQAQFERYPHPGNVGPQGQERMKYAAPFPHGPYPMPGEGFRGRQPDSIPQPNSDRFFRPQAMMPYGPAGSDGRRPHGQPGPGHGDGFRPPFSQVERLRYPYHPPSQDAFLPQGPVQGFHPPGPHPEGGQPRGPSQDSARMTGPVQAFQPRAPGQTGFQPTSQNQDTFRPQVSGHESYRPGQEGLAVVGLRQGPRLSGPGPENAQPSSQERLKPPGPGQERSQPSGPGQESVQQTGGNESIRSPGAEHFPLPSQKTFQSPHPGMEGFLPPYPGHESFRPGQERFGPPGSGQGFRFPHPNDFRPHSQIRPQVSRQEGFQPRGSGHTGFQQLGQVQEGFRPSKPSQGVRPPTTSPGFRPTGQEAFRASAPGPEDLRSAGTQQSFKPPGSNQEMFQPSGSDKDRFRPQVPVSSFQGKGLGHDQPQSGPESFKQINPRFQAPGGGIPPSSTSQENLQRMKTSESLKTSGQESAPSSTQSQERPQVQGPPQGFPFQHPSFQMAGHGFWPPTTGFGPASSHQGFWPPPGHHMRPPGPEGFHLMGHPRSMHPAEHGQGAFPPGFRPPAMGEGGYHPGFRPGQAEGFRPQGSMSIRQSEQSLPKNLPVSKADVSATQSAPGQDAGPSDPAQSHNIYGIQTQGRPASGELKKGSDAKQGGCDMTGRKGPSVREEPQNQPQDLSVQGNRPGPQDHVEQDRRVHPYDSVGQRPPRPRVQEVASRPVDLSQQTKGPNLQAVSDNLAEKCKPPMETESSKPLEGIRSAVPSEQGSVQQQIPPEQEKGRQHQVLPVRSASESCQEHRPQDQQENVPQAPVESQPEMTKKHSEETKSMEQSGHSEVSVPQISSELKEGTEMKGTSGQSGESDRHTTSRQDDMTKSQESTQQNEVCAEKPDRSVPQNPSTQTEESVKSESQAPTVQAEGPDNSELGALSGRIEGSEGSKSEGPSSYSEGPEEPKHEISSELREECKDSKFAGSSGPAEATEGPRPQDTSEQAEEPRSEQPEQSEVSASLKTDASSIQKEGTEDTVVPDKGTTHQGSTEHKERLEAKESEQKEESTPQGAPVQNKEFKPEETEGSQKLIFSGHESTPQELPEESRPQVPLGQKENIRPEATASNIEEIKSQDVSHDNEGRRPDTLGQSEGSKSEESTGHTEEQPQVSLGQDPNSQSSEQGGLKPQAPSGQDGLAPQFPLRPEVSQTQDTEAFRSQGPWMQTEGFRPPYPTVRGDGLRLPGPMGSAEGFRPPGPAGGEGFRPPGPSGEAFRQTGPSGEGFRPPSPSGEGFRSSGHVGEGFRPPGPSGEAFRPPGPAGEGFRSPVPSGPGFRSPGPVGEGVRPPGPSGPPEEPGQTGPGGPVPGSEGFKGQMPTATHTDGFRPAGSTGGTLRPPVPGQGEDFRMPVGAEGFRSHGPEGFHPHGGPEGFPPRGFYPPFQGHPYYPADSGQAFHGGPPGFGMYPPHQFSPDQRMFGPGVGPNPYHPMMPPVSQVPGVPPAGRGGFMIDNLLRSKSGELPPPHMTPPMSTNAPQMTPPQSTPPHGTSPHATPPHATPPHATPPHATPPHSTPPHVTPPHSTPPHQPQIQQLQPLQKKTPSSHSVEAVEKVRKSPQATSQGDEGDDNDVSQIMSYVMNDEFFKQQTGS